MHRRTALVTCLAATGLAAAQRSPDPSIVGRWQGDARLFHAMTRAKTGEIRAELVVSADASITGSVGQAVIPTTQTKSRSGSRLTYEITLSGTVHEHLDVRRSLRCQEG